MALNSIDGDNIHQQNILNKQTPLPCCLKRPFIVDKSILNVFFCIISINRTNVLLFATPSQNFFLLLLYINLSTVIILLNSLKYIFNI